MSDFSDYTEEERHKAFMELSPIDHVKPNSWARLAVTERCKSNRQSAELLRLREMLTEGSNLFFTIELRHYAKPPSKGWIARRNEWLKKAQEALLSEAPCTPTK